MKTIPLIPVSKLTDGVCYEFTIETIRPPLNGFLIMHGGEIHAYQNQCPHTGAPLNWQPHQFLDSSGTEIQCATHGARFAIDNGLCLHGPCVGQSLTPLTVVIDESRIHIALSA